MLTQKKTIFVILGATGDLSVGKIFPALYDLRKKKAHTRVRSLSEAHKRAHVPFSVVGVSRRPWSHNDFRKFLGEKYDKGFLKHVFYKQVFFDSCAGAAELREFLRELSGKDTRFIFYVSMAPALYPATFRCIRKNKLMDIGESTVLIEKPFGLDLASARKLDRNLSEFLEHKQMYRVDHYLGKDALRALTAIHKKSTALSKIMTAKHVSSIRVRLFEIIGVKDRGASYDDVGAFRDVGQNHVLVMLSTIALTPPRSAAPAAWHGARAQVIDGLDISKIRIRRGQYDEYTKEKNVPKSSKTETFFSMETRFTKGKLVGVPVILESGKKMPMLEASIRVDFKNGESLDIRVAGDAYEHVLEAAIAERRELFAGSREILSAWKFVDMVGKKLAKVPLEIYKEGRF